MGTTCTLRWRSEQDRELVWTVNPTHPITRGVPNPIIIDAQEMYGETFDIPAPDELIFISSFTGGEVFRSGCTFRRGHGKIFFFSPGDQDYPVYHHKDVRRVIANGVEWANSDRPERAIPILLRYDTDDFFNGHGYTGPIEDRGSDAPTAEPVRIIQVGAGPMGQAWLKLLGESDQTEPVGLVDLNTDAARQAADAHGFSGVAVAGSLEELFDQVDAQAVVNVTVPLAHASVSNTALLHGLPVLCEKPLAETVSQGLSMIAAAELSGQLLMVSQSRRYWSNLTAFRQQVAQLGPIGTVDCAFFKAPHFGGFRDVMPFPLLIDMAIHQFDLARDLTGSEPVAVYCNSYNPSWSWYAGDAAAEVLFEFASGCRFSFSGSWCSPGLETSWNGEWRVSGERGSAVWDGDHEPTAADGDGRPIAGTVSNGPEQIAGSLAEFVAVLESGAFRRARRTATCSASR